MQPLETQRIICNCLLPTLGRVFWQSGECIQLSTRLEANYKNQLTSWALPVYHAFVELWLHLDHLTIRCPHILIKVGEYVGDTVVHLFATMHLFCSTNYLKERSELIKRETKSYNINILPLLMQDYP